MFSLNRQYFDATAAARMGFIQEVLWRDEEQACRGQISSHFASWTHTNPFAK